MNPAGGPSLVSLLVTYNRVMAAHGLRERRPSRKLMGEFREFADWCSAKRVDPERYMMARHEAIGYRNRIPVRQLASDTFLIKFREWGDDKQAGEQEQARLASSVEPDTQEPQLRALWEQMKRTFSEDPEVCRASQDVTGGYNWRSRWCRNCPVRDRCASDLPEEVRSARG